MNVILNLRKNDRVERLENNFFLKCRTSPKMFTLSKDEAQCLLANEKTFSVVERTLSPCNHIDDQKSIIFKAPCRLTPWYSKKDQPRVITEVADEDEYKRIIKNMPHACEALDGGTVKAYLDIDYKMALSKFYESKGRDGQTQYFEKGGHSPLQRIQEEIQRIPLFHEQKYYAMTRKNRRIKGDKVKVSWRIVFPRVIMANQQALGTYLKAIGYKTDEPFDLSVYNKGRIMNAVYCTNPDKEGDDPCPPLDPLFGWGGELEDRLITVVSPDLPIVNICDWMPKKEVKPAKIIPSTMDVRSNNITRLGHERSREPVDVNNVKKLLSIISADCSYERWFKVLCAVANTLGKNADGVYELADEWSSTASNYTAQSFGKTWCSIHEKGAISIGTLHYLAKEENATLYGELFPKGTDIVNRVNIYISRSYADIKATFEETVFKVIKPVTFYQKKSDAGGYYITTEEKIKAAYRNVMYEKLQKNDTKPVLSSFINDWLRDPDMRLYDRTEFDPSCSVDADVLNMFTGFASERIKAVKDEDVIALVKPFIDHMTMLVGEEGSKFVMMWLANMVQKPTTKANVALVFHSGREGTGKSLPFKYFGEKVVGRDWYKPTSDPVHDLFDKHSNGLENKLLIQVEEARGADLVKNMDRLKDLITNDRGRLERKGVDTLDINNFASFVFTTNNDNPIPISASDRRFVVFDCNDAHVGDEEYFSRLVYAMEKPDMARAMYQYLKEIDLTGVRNFQLIRPITDYYKEIQRINVPNWAKYLAVKSIEGEEEYKASDLYNFYTYWADANGYGQSKLSQTGFALKIKKINGIHSTRKAGGMMYNIDWVKVVAFMKAHTLWDEDAF